MLALSALSAAFSAPQTPFDAYLERPEPDFAWRDTGVNITGPLLFGGVARIRDGGGGGDGGAGSDTTEPPLAKALATSEPSDVDRVCRGEGERRGSWEPIVLPRSADNSSSSAACASRRAAGMSRVETLRLGGIAAGP